MDEAKLFLSVVSFLDYCVKNAEFDETDKFLLISASKSIQHFLFRNGCEELKISSERENLLFLWSNRANIQGTNQGPILESIPGEPFSFFFIFT